MFDGHGSDESRDKAEKASRRGSKDFYPSLLLKCCCAPWSFFAISTWTSSISHMGFKKRHTQSHHILKFCLPLWYGWRQLPDHAFIRTFGILLIIFDCFQNAWDFTWCVNSVECPRVFQLLSHRFVWIAVFCVSASLQMLGKSNNCQFCFTKMCLRKLLWA